ncbi:hypothetical protein G6514_004887 [Epicoccum nigrum]|nr:hypothetical protein G6514_004887 [Epicoccum nigrum]
MRKGATQPGRLPQLSLPISPVFTTSHPFLHAEPSQFRTRRPQPLTGFPAFPLPRPITAHQRPSASSTISDYVENQEYSVQLAAPGDDTFAYDWTRLQEEVESSLFDDITPASLQEDIDVNNDEWARTNDALDNGPWRDIFDWRFDSQGLEAQPGDR